MITTSRYASSETRAFARGMAKEANLRYVARGKKTVQKLADEARRQGEAEVSIIEERDGKPALIITIRIDELGGFAFEGERILNPAEK